MKTYWGVRVYLHAFLTLALDGGEWSASRHGRFTPGERAHGTHWIGGWVGPTAGLDAVAKRKILSLSPSLPARTQALYRKSKPMLIRSQLRTSELEADLKYRAYILYALCDVKKAQMIKNTEGKRNISEY
jgi:hypothetical protein